MGTARRHLDERFALRFPDAWAWAVRGLFRLPPDSRLRQAALRRATRLNVEAMNRGDTEAALVIYADDVEFDVSRDIWGGVVGGGHYHGKEGVTAWLRDLNEAWETFNVTADEVFAPGADQVITVLHAVGRGRSSGLVVEHRPAGVGTVRDGKVVRLVWYPSREEALAAVGLSE